MATLTTKTWDYLTDNDAWFLRLSRRTQLIVPPALAETAMRVLYNDYSDALDKPPTLDEIIDKKIKALNEKRPPLIS